MHLVVPIYTWLEKSVSLALHDIILSDSNHFVLEDNLEAAELIIFENDDPNYIRQSLEFKKYPEKCIAINESDQATYFLPACYSSNRRSWLSYKRAQTIPYYITQRVTPNSFIEQFNNTRSQKYLYSFKGGSTSWVRKKLLKYLTSSNDVYIEDSNHYYHWNNDESYLDQKKILQQQYAELISNSSFVLCPRGAGVSSIRLFEVMQAGRAPVIIADNWIPVDGIPWDEFSLQIPEKSVREIDSIIRSHQPIARDYGLKARQAWVNYCSPSVHSKFLFQSIQIVQKNRNKRREQVIQVIFPVLEIGSVIKSKIRRILKYLILNAFYLTGRKFPYSLNRPIEERINEMRAK